MNHTFVDIDFAVGSLEAGAVAQADERVDAVDTSSVVQAGTRLKSWDILK